MTRLRIIYILSLILMAVLLVYAVYKPMTSEEKRSTIARESIIETESEWIIQFDIINREASDANYTINWSTGDVAYSESVAIKNGGVFTYIQHIYPHMAKKGSVSLVIYKKGESEPLIKRDFYPSFN